MMRSSRPLLRRVSLACLLIAALLAAPVAAWFVRPTIFFSASFDISGAPGSSLPQAEVGQFEVPTPPEVFQVVTSPTQGGELKISDQGTLVEELLAGQFKKQFVGQELFFGLEIKALQTTTDLVVNLLDDSDSGMIDVSFGGDGMIRIGGKPVAPYVAGTVYDIGMNLHDPIAGAEFWTATVTTSAGSLWTQSGPLLLTGPLTVRSVEIVRPAGSSAGEFRVDDMIALSYKLSFGL
jgi:hypothetical protein